ncbi:MAG: septum formation inhibitor Maf [Oscillatoriales cyanobacterium]|nr:MAG: septum formation inhibitor Maf [Oscillatoriales cyanobacterium]
MTIPDRSLLILASASPARRQLLHDAGFEPIVCPSDVDESQVTLTNPAALVQTLAQLKAEHIAERIRQQPDILASPSANPDPSDGDRTPSRLVLGCDSVLSLEGKIYGKPASPEEAIARWQAMRGTTGELYTGHVLIDLERSITLVNCAMTRVHFAMIDDATIAAYVATGEPLGCAGCFAIDGRGALFVEQIEGCHTNVIGLSLPLLRQMLHELGYAPQNFWTIG